MTARTLLAATLAAGALATAAPANAATGGPYCAFHPICDKIAAIIGHHGAASVEDGHTICHTVEQQAPWLVYCHD